MLTEGAEDANRTNVPKYAAPFWVKVPVAMRRAPTPYDWTADPMIEVPHAAAVVAASFDLKNSSFEFAACACL